MRNQLYLLFFVSLLFGCSKEDNAIDKALENTDIESSLRPYVESFVQEAANRNLRISFRFTGLSVRFGIVKESEDAIGFCTRETFDIKIDKTAWDNLSENHREVLVFHELGHCKMQRGHREDLLANGEVTSIMWPGIQGKFFGERRKYYIDELFSPNTNEPAWAFKTAEYPHNYSREIIFSEPSATTLNQDFKFDTARDFEIEFELINIEKDRAGIAWGAPGLDKAVFITTRSPSQLDIETGIENFGRVFSDPFLRFANDTMNKITIRKVDDEYLFFINEEFIFWMEFIPFQNNLFQTFSASDQGVVNSDAPIQVKNFKVSYLD